MTEDQIAIIDIISDAVKSINNCLQCRICLETISSPVKTRCGHSFCRTCIAVVLNKKNGRCPLCNTNLQRRSISKDKHIEKSIKSFEKLLEAIRKDVNIDILNYQKNPRNTREGYGTPDAKHHNSSCIPNAEEKRNENSSSCLTKKITSVEQPSCSSLHRDITDERDTTNKEYMKGKITKNDDYAKEIKERNSSSTDEMSGVYPLLSSPQLPKVSTSDDIVFMKEKRIKNWLESLSNTEHFENPNGSPKLLTNLFLDDTATVVSGISLISSVSNIKAEKEFCVSDHSNYAVEEASNSTKATETSSDNIKKKEKIIPPFLEREIIPDSTEHKLKYKAIHARARQRLAKVNDKKPVKDVNDSIKSSKDTANSVNKQKQLKSSCTTKETWNRVVKIGKEMRSKKKKLKSLDISKESTNIRRNQKLSATNLQIDAFNREKKDESIKIEIDQEEENIIECNSTYDKSNETIEQKSLQNTSFISLEKEGRVPIMSLRREQMDDIIGVATNINESTNDQEGNPLNREDHGTIPKKRLSLRKRNDSKNSSITNFSNADRSLSKNTPVKVNLEERYSILCDSPPLLSTRNKHTTPIKSNENSKINKSMLKLSLKDNQTSNIKSKEITAIPKVTQLSNPKCNLMEKINRDKLSRDLFENVNKIIDKSIIKSTEKNDIDHTNTNLITNDRKIRIVPFNKLGTVFKKRRKVKFYKLGHVKRESLINPLTIAVLNSYKVNMVTFEESDDILETCKMEEECNLLDHRKSTMNLIVEKDIRNNEIHLLKDKDTKSSSKNPTQDSLDVLLISLKEPTNENIVNVNDQRINSEIGKSSSKKRLENCSKNGICSKPIITNIVKMISLEDDSQLRYLDLESMVEPIPVKLKISNESTGLGFKRKSERNNDDTSLGQIINDKKIKLINHSMENETRNKQIKESSDESDSNNSESVNNMTQIDKFNVDIVDKINNNENVDIAISLKSESDNNMNNKKVTIDALNESKKQKYKRIMIAHSSSDTDASSTRKRKIDIDENKDNKKVKISKKKDIVSEDSDDDNLVNEIVNNWCNDLDTMKSTKKINSKEVKNLKTMVMIPQSIDFDSWNNYDTLLNIIPEKVAPERSNNDIIDKVKMIQMDENDKMTSNKIKGIDNLDEVETITDSSDKNFFMEDNIVGNKNQLENNDKKNILPPTNSSYMETNMDFLDDLNGSKIEENFEDTLIENFNGSNKENETARNSINNKNDITTKKNIMSKEKDENKRTTTTAPAIATVTLISEKEKYEDFGKSKGQLIEQKDISCEYDSFMNVTQDQLLLKALEEDLFGAANSRSLEKSTNTKTLSQERRLESSSQTPTKSKRNLEVTTNLYNKNAQNAREISSDEDEIIENTPQSNKKFMETDRSVVNSKARKSLTMSQTTTPMSSKKFQQVATLKTTTTTPSLSVSSKFKTLIDQNKIQPIYQSTPKIIQTTFNRDCGPSHSQDNKKSFESNANVKVESKMTSRMETKVNNKRLCFVWSSLMIEQIECIKKLASLINATWTQNFNSTVTHVIVATNEETNAATKTLKFLQGIAHRKFVISFKWIIECLKKGTLIDEEPYEAVDCYTLEAGPRKSRLRESDLFEGFAFTCIEPFQNITVTQFQDLLTAMGGTIAQNMAALSVIKNKHKIILIQSEIHRDEVVANWYDKTSAVPISCDWIVECISQYKLISCYTHLHEVVQEEDVLKLGYPEQMIDPDEFNSTYDTSVGYKSR